MLEHLLGREFEVVFQELRDEIFSRLRHHSHSIVENDHSLPYIFIDFFLLLVVERRLEIEQLVSHNPQAVQIDALVISLRIDHFRTQILDSPTDSVPFLITVNTAPKICQLDIIVLIKKDIFEFDISVHDMAVGHVYDCVEQLLNYGCYFLLGQDLLQLLNYIDAKVLGSYKFPCSQY